jgi:hypothetical protein
MKHKPSVFALRLALVLVVFSATPLGIAAAASLATSPSWVAESNQAGAQGFMPSASTAGDVNGDGYDDVIVAASGYDNGETDEGRVFVYYGSPTGLSTVPDWTAESNQAGAQMGYPMVRTAGDVNGDGYADIIVSAAYYDNGQTDEGAAFVWYGSASGLGENGTPANADWMAEGDQASAYLCNTIGTAGDINGDGYSDIFVGTNWYDHGEGDEGAVFVWYGSASGLGPNGTPANADWMAESNQGFAMFGLPAVAGDVNGDGYNDVVVGAGYYSNGQSREGAVFAWYGSAAGLGSNGNPSNADWMAEGDQANAWLGGAPDGLDTGDFNSDGYADVIAGAGAYDIAQADVGQAFVWYGSASGLGPSGNPSNADWTIQGNQASAQLGFATKAAGDVNGDGYTDVIVSAPYYSNGESSEGQGYVYFGGSTGLSTTPDWTAEINQAYAYFGECANTAGDVNGDGHADVIFCAKGYDNGQTDEGAAFVYYSSPPVLSATPSTVSEIYPGDTVEVDLDITGAANLYAAQAECGVDPSVLEPQSAVFGSFFDPVNRLIAANEVSPTLGTWFGAISQQNPAGPLSGDGNLATITYQALAPGTTDILCNPLFSNRDGFTQTVSFTGASITVLPYATINGTATYQGRLDHTGIEIVATGPVTRTALTDAAGAFVLDELRAGSYNVIADTGSYLPVCITPTLAAGDALILSATQLAGGDLNDDVTINIGDATLLTANFNETVPPADARADINADGVINVQDLAILAGNYEISGCQPW